MTFAKSSDTYPDTILDKPSDKPSGTSPKKELHKRLNKMINESSRVARSIISDCDNMIDQLSVSHGHRGPIQEVISWDCGLKSTSWSHMEISNGSIDILSCGTIDFLSGKKFKSVPRNDWPALIKSALETRAPKVSSDCIVAIESQPQRSGAISAANLATQFGIGFHYSKNKIMFVSPIQKNRLGPISMASVARELRLSDEALRKKHTRLNFELFMLAKYRAQFDQRRNSCTHTVKLRDAADAFMQGIYCATK